MTATTMLSTLALASVSHAHLQTCPGTVHAHCDQAGGQGYRELNNITQFACCQA